MWERIWGGSWAPFGAGLGGSRTSCGRSWATLGRFGSVRNRTLFIYWSTMVSERPLGSNLDRFRRGFGSMWERIWMLLARLGADSKLLLDVLFVATFRTGTPSLLRYAPRSVTIRGGSPTPRRVRSWHLVLEFVLVLLLVNA